MKLLIEALENLHEIHEPQLIADATKAILHYLDHENPYFLTYRFGPKLADAMRPALDELLALSTWAAAQGLRLYLILTRHFYSLVEQKEVKQIQQSRFDHWM